MKTDSDVLIKLKEKRAQNISDAQSWPNEDVSEMIATYQTAKEIAVESNDQEAIAVLNEKISQLEEASRSKKISDAQL